MLAGPNGLNNGSWGNSSVAELLPTRMDDVDEGFQRSKARVQLTPMGRQSPMLKTQ